MTQSGGSSAGACKALAIDTSRSARRWNSVSRATPAISTTGGVEVYAVGPVDKLSKLAGMLYRGPQWSDVRGVEEQEAAIQEYGTFRIT